MTPPLDGKENAGHRNRENGFLAALRNDKKGSELFAVVKMAGADDRRGAMGAPPAGTSGEMGGNVPNGEDR